MEETEKEIESTGGGGDETSGIQTSSKSSVKQPNIRRRWKNYELEYEFPLNSSDMINIIAIFDKKGSFVNNAFIQENILYVYLRKGMFLLCFKYYFMLLNMCLFFTRIFL